MRVSILLASMGFFFVGACDSGKPAERRIHEALLDRNNLPDSIFNNPYGTTAPASSKVNWIEPSSETGPTNRSPSYNRPEDVAAEEQAKREGLCTSVEYPADGRIGAAERRQLQGALNDAKEDLLS